MYVHIHKNLYIERKELVSWMKDQESSIYSISIHASGRHAVTTANEIAQIWDLDTFTKKKTLNGAQTVGIQQVTSNQYWISKKQSAMHLICNANSSNF